MVDHEAVITLADVVSHLREQLISAINTDDLPLIEETDVALRAIEDTIIALAPNRPKPELRVLDHMISAVQDYFHEETWKSTIPTEDQIREVFSR